MAKFIKLTSVNYVDIGYGNVSPKLSVIRINVDHIEYYDPDFSTPYTNVSTKSTKIMVKETPSEIDKILANMDNKSEEKEITPYPISPSISPIPDNTGWPGYKEINRGNYYIGDYPPGPDVTCALYDNTNLGGKNNG